MQFDDLIRAGQLSEALSTLQGSIRKDAANPRLRVALFQLYCVLGDWNKALNQLDVCAQLDAAALPMQQTYRELIACERLREAVFRGDKVPMVFGEPQPWLASLIEALLQECAGHGELAVSLRTQALDAAAATEVTLPDGSTHSWIADADSRLGPVLEAVINGKYFWVPFAAIGMMRLEKPCDLRDLVWAPAHLEFVNGAEAVAFIPTRYVFTAPSQNAALLLSRLTHWEETRFGQFVGLGQRLFALPDHDLPLLESSELRFTTSTHTIGTEPEAPAIL